MLQIYSSRVTAVKKNNGLRSGYTGYNGTRCKDRPSEILSLLMYEGWLARWNPIR
jgi:hypothetical protein